MTTVKGKVDEHQYNFMTTLADEWWDPKGASELLHLMNNVRVTFVCDQLEMLGKIKDKTSLKGLKILDAGCGAGIFAEALAKLGADVVGLDPVDALIESGKNHMKSQKSIENNLKYVCETIEEHAVKNLNTYDVIVCSEVIEHVETKRSFIEACCKVLKPGGDFFLTTPNKTFASYFFVYLWAEKILNIIEKGNHNWHWFIHHNDMAKMLREFGVRTVRTEGLSYYPIIKKWTISNYKGTNYVLHAVKENYPKE